MKETGMKTYLALTALALLAAGNLSAQSLDRWDIKKEAIRAPNNHGGYLCGTTTATSFTIVSGTLYALFDPSLGHNVCVENTAQAVCGSGRPTSGSGTTNAWSRNPSVRWLADANNGAGSQRPNRMWVQLENASDCVYWHNYSGLPNE
jgi:hypothetical protein